MKHRESGPSQRQLRVGEQIRHSIVQTLQRGKFNDELLFEVAPLVTVAEVRTTPDLKQATAYIMPLGLDNAEEIVDALNEAAYYFQKQINQSSNLKFTPRVRFKIDDTFDEAAKIDTILQNIPKYAEDSEEEE
ncbi:MAG: 30S ribosome-binding factor RbfA [Pseudomonadota bacterium]|jgi:ribosome-binding factor A|nr:ribosome-binding factor A [Alphaproteobacteria bacterium]MEC7577015.1 30S ribosome-binding factor RbfA [Pseudomonadota bacterium]MEC7702818.1 30S ribosome-binding factor RbfA [Pseudomonadota bacterium]MEC9235519.1 30S ribosome-binding factor RbfA [Pseudomonadota bacterium]MED5422557.1 30S ribosome-binding factor RbfA [Pseudomonadota bacterium]|tara:strand:- start:2069 stop:2467 length:399 start_codon:yes stop_codon:yes gene_type:complete